MTPLMTSYQTEKVWQFPNDPFVSYESKDESWCRYFGIGQETEQPAKLFDVRDLACNLIGYVRIDPTKNRGSSTRIPCIGPISVFHINLRKEQLRINTPDGWKNFVCWTCSKEDAEFLTSRGRMIRGKDNLLKFEEDLRNGMVSILAS